MREGVEGELIKFIKDDAISSPERIRVQSGKLTIKYKKLEVTTQLMIKKNNKGRGRGLINFLPLNGEGGGELNMGKGVP